MSSVSADSPWQKALPSRCVALGPDRGEHRAGPRGWTRSSDPARGRPGGRGVALGRLPPFHRPRGAVSRGVALCAQRARRRDAPTGQPHQGPPPPVASGRHRLHRLRTHRARTVSHRVHLTSRHIPRHRGRSSRPEARTQHTPPPAPTPTRSLVKYSTKPKPPVYWILAAGREQRSPPGQRSTAWPACCSTDRYPLAPQPSNSRENKYSTSSSADC